MSEKRFTLNLMKKPSEIEMDGKMISKYDVVRLLNEQQATISALTKENKELGKNFEDLVEWVSGIAKRNVVLDEKIGQLQRENEQLRQQLKEKEEDEQLYANEIVKLNKEAKEVLDFKSLGGDY